MSQQAILKRKDTAAVYVDAAGCPHPDMVLALAAPLEDKRTKYLELNVAYYHNLGAYKNGCAPLLGMRNICMRFTEDFSSPTEYNDAGQPIRLGYPTYSDIKKDIVITEDGELEILDEDGKLWFLNQQHALDFDNKVFAEDWEFVAEV